MLRYETLLRPPVSSPAAGGKESSAKDVLKSTAKDVVIGAAIGGAKELGSDLLEQRREIKAERGELPPVTEGNFVARKLKEVRAVLAEEVAIAQSIDKKRAAGKAWEGAKHAGEKVLLAKIAKKGIEKATNVAHAAGSLRSGR